MTLILDLVQKQIRTKSISESSKVKINYESLDSKLNLLLQENAKKALALGTGGAMALGGAYYGTKSIANSINSKIDNAAANRVADILKSQQSITHSASPASVISQAPTTFADKNAAAAKSLTNAASEWGSAGKSAAGSLVDAAAANPHGALGGAGLAGLALINRLRRNRQ